MLNVSGPELVLLLVLAVVWAVVGYRLSEADRRTLGRTPWGLPSAVWALFWFLSLALGLILYLFAHRAEVRRGPGPAVGPTGAPGAVPPTAQSSGSDFPAYPRRADGGMRVPHVPAPAPAVGPPTAEQSPPAWHPDPSGRFHYRWWTGTEWTSYVSTDGTVVVDTSPDQRIGPY